MGQPNSGQVYDRFTVIHVINKIPFDHQDGTLLCGIDL